MYTAAITSGDIAAEIKSQSEAASPAVERTTEETTQPAITAPAVVDEHGPIPFERHEAILGKTRREADEKLSRLSGAGGRLPEGVKEAQERQQRYSDANAQIDQAMNWPGFDEYMPDITAAVTAARARGESITLADAYIRAGGPRKIAERSTAKLAE